MLNVCFVEIDLLFLVLLVLKADAIFDALPSVPKN